MSKEEIKLIIAEFYKKSGDVNTAERIMRNEITTAEYKRCKRYVMDFYEGRIS